MEPQDVFTAVRPTLAQVLRVEEASIRPESSLSEDLGAESIDLAEIQIVLEEMYAIRVSEESIAAYLMGGMTPEDFYDEERNVTPRGMERLTAVVPGFDASRWAHGELNMYTLWRVLTVDALCRYACHAVEQPPLRLSR